MNPFRLLLDLEKARRSCVLALRSLWLHKLRAFLSVLGIIIGTASVIALMAFGEGSMQDTLDDIRRQGATNVIVRSVKPPDGSSGASRGFLAIYGITREDYQLINETLGDVIVRRVPMKIFPQAIYRGKSEFQGRVVATTPEYAEVNQLKPVAGRFLVQEDLDKRENVAVLGRRVAETLFPYDGPIGQTIYIGPNAYRIIGLLDQRMPAGGTGGSQAAEDYNNDIYIPLETGWAWFGERLFIRGSGSRSFEQVELSQVTYTVSDMSKVRPVADMLRDIMKKRHGFKQDWVVTAPLDRLEEAERAKDRFTRLLVLIASISLLVGGIGIMNIMLATVTERTREIGIRRALGAKRRDITLQFLVEAVVQTSIGGVLGVLLGLAAVYGLPILYESLTEAKLPAKIHVPSIFLSLFVSIGVGVLFGWYPAQRAAKLDPIEALRHD